MRKIVLSLIAVLAFAAMSFAANPSATQLVTPDWDLVAKSTAPVRVTGTVAGTLISKQSIVPGWEYVLVTVDSVNAADDTAYTTLIGYGADGATQTSSNVITTHRNAVTYTVTALPIGSTVFGKSFSITLTRWNATNKTKITLWELYKRRIQNANVDYKVRH